MTRRIAELAAVAFVSGVTSLVAFGLGTGIAQADPPTSGTWCPGQPVPGGFTEVDWDWTVCHNYYLQVRGMPRQIVGMKVQDGAIGGNWRLVAGEDANPTCQVLCG
jgi:hypothetical protein